MMLVKFQLAVSAILTFAATMTTTTTALTVRHAATAGQDTPRALSAPTSLRIERGLVTQEEVQTLYQEILEVAVPGPRDGFHRSLLGIMGDAGAHVERMTSQERVTQFRRIMEPQGEDFQARGSGILRIEHLQDTDRDKVKRVVNEGIENRVLEDEGTIHVYLSRPNSAALPNHTDTTDIFVLQLDGAKEWTLCEDPVTFYEKKSNLRNKLDKCSTYDHVEMSGLVCHRETLYPGDALYLPKRVVHSARPTAEGVSVHLTFGFSNHMCSLDSKEQNDSGFTPREGWSVRRFLQGTCNAAQGGSSCDSDCDENCNTSCNGSCDAICTCSCDDGLIFCDDCCNDSCDSYCDGSCTSSCDSGCDTCPGTGPTPTPPTPGASPNTSTTSSSTEGLSGGAKAGISIVGLAVVAIAVGVGVWVCKKQKRYCFKGNPVTTVGAEDTAKVIEVQPGTKEVVVKIVENPDGSKTKTTVTTSFAANGDKIVDEMVEKIAAP